MAMEMGSESNMKCSVSILIGLKHEETLPPSTMPTTDAAVDVDHGMWTLNEFTGNNNMLLEENGNFYRWQRKKSRMNSDSDSRHILKKNIVEENLSATPKDHIVPLDQKSKMPSTTYKNSIKPRVRRIGFQHI